MYRFGMGSGWLTLPKAFGIYGVASGLILMAMSSISSIIAIKILAKMMNEYKINSTYPLLVKEVLGNGAKNIINILYSLCLFGTLLAYGLVCNKFFCNVFEKPLASLFEANDNENFQKIVSLSAFMLLVFISLPLMLMTDTSKFGSLSFVSVATLFFVMTLICVQSPSYSVEYNPTNEMKMFNNLDNPLMLLQNISLFTFSLYMLDVFFLVTNGLGKAATEKNIMKISTVSVSTLLVPFVVIGILGYISFGSSVTSLDLFPARPALLGSSDLMMNIAQVLIIFGVCLGNISRFIAFKN